MGAVDEFNSLAFERLELAATYTDLSLQLEKLLEEVRSETSRARSINGLTLTAAAGPGATDLEPYTRVNVSGDDFSLQDFEASEEGDSKVRKRTSTKGNSDEEPKEKTDEKKQGLPQGAFRPFGILEPNSAKDKSRLYLRFNVKATATAAGGSLSENSSEAPQAQVKTLLSASITSFFKMEASEGWAPYGKLGLALLMQQNALRVVLYTPDKRPVHQFVLQRGEEDFRHQLSFNGLYIYFHRVQEGEKQLSIVFAEAQREALLTFAAWVSLQGVGRVRVKYTKRKAHS
ncbi:unnamed protein product, partial [Mesorhabditis spiculigera]